MKSPSSSGEFQRAKETVFRLLRFRMRSENEIRDKLKIKGISHSIIEKTVDYFKKIDIIDDRAFTRGWINSRLNKPYGIYRIRRECLLKGIDKELFEEELKKASSDYDELDPATSLAQKRLMKYEGIPIQKAKKRILDYLTRRGFSSRTIHKVLQQIKR